MIIKNVIIGVALIVFGIWLTFIQSRRLANGRANTLGGASGLLIGGIACVISGIILIVKYL